MSAATPFPQPLGNAETELRRLLENAPVGVAHCTRQGTVMALNPALEQIMGGEGRVAKCSSASDLLAPANPAESRRLFRDLFDGQRDSFEMQGESYGPNRSDIKWTVWRVRGSSGRADYALAIAEEKKESAHGLHLRRVNEDRLAIVGRLTGGVAHDFNNLLTGVLLYCELLMAGVESGSRPHGYAQEIRSAATQASGLVSQLLRVARPDNGEAGFLSLNDVLQGMRTLLVRLIGENIGLDLRLDPSLGLVKMEATQVQQILLNLVLNARDAMAEGGRIAVETSNCNLRILAANPSGEGEAPSIACALLTVTDDGEGMDSVSSARLFEPFFTTKPAGAGNGLGLKTVHDIVTGSGGLIHVESAKNSGTRVTVLLPLVRAAGVSNSTAKNTTPRPHEGDLPPIEKD